MHLPYCSFKYLLDPNESGIATLDCYASHPRPNELNDVVTDACSGVVVERSMSLVELNQQDPRQQTRSEHVSDDGVFRPLDVHFQQVYLGVPLLRH